MINDNNKIKKYRKTILFLLLFCFAGAFCGVSVLAVSHNRVTAFEASEIICSNLIASEILENQNYCVISSNFRDFIPKMFPVNEVDRAYVEAGMEGFYLPFDSENRKTYGIVRTITGLQRSPWINFEFDNRGRLVDINYND